jgi:hypothetical protein
MLSSAFASQGRGDWALSPLVFDAGGLDLAMPTCFVCPFAVIKVSLDRS